jgi:aryl-alcohol dehydrogenase-like predicted oxidoreductase
MGKYLNHRGRRILTALDKVARKHKASPAEVALAWSMARPGLTAPIASATTPDQLKELVAAAMLVLEASDVEALDIASVVEASQLEPA